MVRLKQGWNNIYKFKLGECEYLKADKWERADMIMCQDIKKNIIKSEKYYFL